MANHDLDANLCAGTFAVRHFKSPARSGSRQCPPFARTLWAVTLTAVSGAFAFLLAVSPAGALDGCGGQGGAPDAEIAACSDLISSRDSRGLSKTTLAAAYRVRAFAYAAKDDHDRAIADYDEVIRLDPSYATAFYSRGFSYYRKNEYDRAISDFDQAIRLDPNHASAHRRRGDAWLGKANYDRAIADFDQAIR